MQTVVGVFDSINEAERARASLTDAGFDESEVRVQSQASMQDSDYTTGTGRTTTRSDDDEGFMAGVGRFFSELFGGDDNDHVGHYSEAVRRGNAVVVVTVQDESRVEAARSALAAAGAVDIDKRAESWREQGYSGFDPASRPFGDDEIQADRNLYQARPEYTASSAGRAQMQMDDSTVMPVVREELDIGKKQVDLGAVRVFTRTETRPVQEQVQLREERAEIERRPVDRPATEADLKAFGGGSIEVREMAEKAVVSKTARVVEEVVVGTKATTRTETVSDQVRNTVVDVEKMGQDRANLQSTPDYRSHYQTNLAAMGGAYEDYEPAYQYGSTLRADSRYANRSWDDVEADAQRDWSGRYPGTPWEKAKAAVRHGWETVTGQR